MPRNRLDDKRVNRTLEAGIPIDVVLPLVIAAMMLGVGMNLRVADFAALASAPRAAAVGLVNMFVIFPALAFPIAWFYSLSPVLAVGLVLLAASPSASTSTLFTHLARGDVALSLSLTAISKLVPVLTIPVYVGFAAAWFSNKTTELTLTFTDTSERLVVMVLLPIVIGMMLRHRWPAFANRVRPWITGSAVIALVLVIVVLVIREREALPGMLLAAGPAALTLCLLGVLCAWFSTGWFRLPEARRCAITIEAAMQSGGTAIAIAAGVLATPAMAVPAAVYSLLMYVVAGMLVLMWRGRLVRAGAPA